MTIENGQVIDTRKAGYQVIAPNQEEASGTNSNTHS